MKTKRIDPAENLSPEEEERARLAAVQCRLNRLVKGIDERLARYQHDIQAQKAYLWENKADMDHAEKVSTRQSIEQMLMTGDSILAQKNRLLKLARAPYFGRFDFTRSGQELPEPFYIGVHHLYDEHDRVNLVYDWRAPIATLFYDFETGPAAYTSLSGEISGEVTLKRQFRIRDGEMEFMLESGLHIVDDVLQQELARASDDGMKNIVATIQRDQNAIIRDDHAQTLIIQGVAGSGKTSIALHRIAFLLYRFKETLTSKDILIISPNRVFADYIANVLPELGEESVAEIGMERLADELLEHKVRFQSYFEQTASLLEKNDEAMKERISSKSSTEFLKKLDEYADHVEATRFTGEDVSLDGRLVPGWFIEKFFAKYRGMALARRITEVVRAVETNVGIQYNYDIGSEGRKTLRNAIRKMHRTTTLRNAYKEYYDWMGRPELFKPARGGGLEYADVFPLIYLKLRLEGIDNPYSSVKHLLIDEMQDYTPVQYAVIARLFACRKTILGDVAQSVNPYSASTPEDIRDAFSGASYMTLTRSYRSTLQIMEFVQHIRFNPDLIPMARHGEPPRIVACQSKAEEMTQIRMLAEEYLASKHNSLGIVCKTQKEAEKVAVALSREGIQARLLDASSTLFSNGVIVCTAHLAKGLEFDRVIVPDASATAYHTPMDRNMLYVACTRAMHLLVLTHTAEPSTFLHTSCLTPCKIPPP
ncbi:MAG: 3'-5' exonuclease [Desulfuromonadales bacterium]|nr:3'-5' exonuclease [Desulfuromonadales bacterium]MDW7757371.1 3'-5' exonuclease [Desulfuromonadales bacterium]